MPEGETPCGISGDCSGWCLDTEYCLPDIFGCYCDPSPCMDSDGGYYPLIGGTCYPLFGAPVEDYCDLSYWDILIEYECSPLGCVPHEINCTTLYGVNYVCEIDKFGPDECVEGIF